MNQRQTFSRSMAERAWADDFMGSSMMPKSKPRPVIPPPMPAERYMPRLPTIWKSSLVRV